MSVVIETHIQCDGRHCPETFGLDDRSKTAGQHRKEFKFESWTNRGGRDYCPDCLPAADKKPE